MLGHLRKCEIECLRMEQYAERVAASYCHGTFRAGPLQQVSLVGQVAEESGGYLPDLLGEWLHSHVTGQVVMDSLLQTSWSRAPSSPRPCPGDHSLH